MNKDNLYENETREPPTCKDVEKQFCGPIAWKLLNEINHLITLDMDKDDFHDVMIHPKGYLCIRRASTHATFGFEFRIPIKDIQRPAKLSFNKELNISSVFMTAKYNKKIVQVMQFVDEASAGTDLGYSSGLSDGVGVRMSDIRKAKMVLKLMNLLLDHLIDSPTLTYAGIPSFWGQ